MEGRPQARVRHTSGLISAQPHLSCVISPGRGFPIYKTEVTIPATQDEDVRMLGEHRCMLSLSESTCHTIGAQEMSGLPHLSILKYLQFPQDPFSKKKVWQTEAGRWVGGATDTTPFLILSSPFLPSTHHFSSGRPG